MTFILEFLSQTWPVSANLDIVDEILIVCKVIFNMLSVGS